MSPSSEPAITLTLPESDKYGFCVQEIEGHEELGCLFEYRLDLLSQRHDIDLKSLLGKPVTVHIPLEQRPTRHLSGMVFRAERGPRQGEDTGYRMTLLPEQHLLSYCHDCRILQGVTVIEVVERIFAAHKLRPFRAALYETDKYRRWDYLTQYQESDWDFVRRILALEGIYFYFNHLENGHELVLADSISSHDVRAGWETVPLLAQVNRGANPDSLRQWGETSEIGTSDVVLRDFDFRVQGDSAILAGKKGTAATDGKRTLERYEYPGGFAMAENGDRADAGAANTEGERLATVRLEEKQSSANVFVGEGTAGGLGVGALFGISAAPGLSDRQFTIVATDLRFRNPAPETSGLAGNRSYVRLTAIDRATPFRMRRLEKPIVRGPQTARVVGPKDEEIWTDKYGRIKLQFHWDRDTERKGEHRSCWVRVAHPWAGNRWGAIHLPRVGNEVVVDFLEGDPDRPLVTGSVYNADNMPPYALPENKTQSGIKTRSSKGGTEANFNEIRFEDKKGHEELHIQAEGNMSTLVKHDQSLTVHGNRKVTVHGASTGTHHGGRNETIQNGDSLTVERSDKTTMVGGEYNIVAVKHYNVSSGESAVCDVDLKEGVATITAAKGIDLVCGDASLSLKKDGLATITAANEINLVCGGASLSLKSDGTVTIQGKKTLNATGAESKLELAAAGATLSGQNAKLSGQTMTDISGGTVKIN